MAISIILIENSQLNAYLYAQIFVNTMEAEENRDGNGGQGEVDWDVDFDDSDDNGKKSDGNGNINFPPSQDIGKE